MQYTLFKSFNLKKIFPILIIFLYWSHFLILGQDTYLLIHDNLDSVYSYFDILKKNNLFFADSSSEVRAIGVGIPREVLPGQFSIVSLLFFIFPSFVAYAVNSLLQHYVAYFSMSKLLTIFKKEEDDQQLIRLASLCFALLPFYPFGSGTIPFMPLTFYCFYKIRNEQETWIHYALLLLIPFYSSFYLASMFTVTVCGLFWIFDSFKLKKINSKIFLMLVVHTLVYLATDYRLVMHVLNHTFISQRVEFIRDVYPLNNVLRNAINLFVNGQYHAHSWHKFIILPFSIFCLVYAYAYKKTDENIKAIRLLLLIGLLTSIISAFWSWEFSEKILSRLYLLKTMNLSRIYFFFPLIWTLTLFFIIRFFKKKFGLNFVFFISSVQILILFFKSDFYNNFSKIKISYNDFFAMEEISDVKNQLPKGWEDFKFMAIGFHPSVLNFSGLKSLDFYLPHYPLEYKKKFMRFLSEELSLNEKVKNYFVHYGIRAYFYTHQLGIVSSMNQKTCPMENIEIPKFDYKLILENRGRFFLSICSISGWKPSYVTNSKLYGKLYLYDITEQKID